MEHRNFCAFISYRHFSPDMEIAKRLHTLIENYNIPSSLRKATGRKHPGQVFRDQEELPLSSDLGRDIETALVNSDWLICVCSPRYLESRWCMRELEFFLETHPRDRVLTVLADGDPESSFPELLRYEVNAEGEKIPMEPLAADVRGSTLRESLKKLKKEKLRLLAPMLGTSYDGLYQRQHRRAVTRSLSALAAVAVAAAGISLFLVEQNRRVENERIASARSEFDLLLEQASASLAKNEKKQAAETVLQARRISGSLGGYREDAMLPILAEACYRGDLSPAVSLQSSVDPLAVSILYSAEFFSPDGSRVLCPVSAYTLDCCDTATGKLLWSARFDEQITSARWKADSSQVAVTAHAAHTLRVIDAKNGSTVHELNQIPWISAAAFAGDDLFLAFEQGFLVWLPQEDPEAQDMAWHMQDQFTQLCNARVSPDGRWIARHTESALAVLDMSRREDPRGVQGYVYPLPDPKVISGYTLSPDGKKLFIHQFDRVFTADLETDETLWSADLENSGSWPDGLPDSAGPAPVWAGDIIYDHERDPMDYLSAAGILYSAETGEVIRTTDAICMGITADGQYFLCSDGLYRTGTGEPAALSSFRLYAADPAGRYYLTDGALVTALGKGSQYTLENYTGTLFADCNEQHRCVSPDDQYTVIWNANEPGFTVLKTDGSNEQYQIRDFTPQWFISFSADSRFVALGSGMGGVAVYELSTGSRLYLNTDWAAKAALGGITFSPDGKWIMYANYAKTWFSAASLGSGSKVYEMHAAQPVRSWGFDSATGDAVIVYEDGSALCADIFTSTEELFNAAEAMVQGS